MSEFTAEACAANMQSLTLKDGPRLPIEIVLEIMESLAPSNPGAILPATDITTKTLLSFTRVCRETSLTASRLLRKHCMYIDTPAKAQRAAQSIVHGSVPAKIERMFLSPFQPYQPPSASSVAGQDWDTLPSSITESAEADAVDTESWTTDYGFAPLDDMDTATAIRDMLLAVAPTLRSLAIDMPLRSLYPEDDHNNVRPVLRQGFEALVNLEEFASVQDELFLDTKSRDEDDTEEEVWAMCWPKLKRLALYNVDLSVDRQVWQRMAFKQHLEKVIFARADSDTNLYDFDLKDAWLSAVDGLSRSKEMTIVLVDCPSVQPVFTKRIKRIWEEKDTENEARVLLADVKVPKGYRGEPWRWGWMLENNPISQTQTFLRMHAVQGTLWDDVAFGSRPPTFKSSGRRRRSLA